MILDKESHKAKLLALLEMPGLTLFADPEKPLKAAAAEYLELLAAVENATVSEPVTFAKVMPDPLGPEE